MINEHVSLLRRMNVTRVCSTLALDNRSEAGRLALRSVDSHLPI